VIQLRFVVAATLSLFALAPHSADAATCNMWQKAIEIQFGVPCESFTAPFDPPPTAPFLRGDTAGTFFPVWAPKCRDGSDCSDESAYVRNLDGTRPAFYIDPVAGSSKWLFFFQGGGACGKEIGLEAEIDCSNIYRNVGGDKAREWAEMSTEHPLSGRSSLKAKLRGQGINSVDEGNYFKDFNRVIINKGTYDRWLGNRTYTSTSLVGDDNITLYFHGRRLIRAVVKRLEMNESSFAVGEDGRFELVPDINDASIILFAGHSGGASNLFHNAEWLEELAASVAPLASVGFVADARLIPDAAGEAHFEPTPVSIWNADYSGTSHLTEDDSGNGVFITRSHSTYDVDGEDRDLMETWGDHTGTGNDAFLDASCLATHSGSEEWRCYDEAHVLFHHFDQPLFLHQTLLDEVHRGVENRWVDLVDVEPAGDAVSSNFVWSEKPADTGDDYLYEAANRVLYMADELLRGRRSSAPVKRDSGTAATNKIGVYIAYGNQHATIQEPPFFNHFMSKKPVTVSFHDALQQWTIALESRMLLTDRCWIQDATTIDEPLVSYVVTAMDGRTTSCNGWSATDSWLPHFVFVP
jgi:hypothetical protein